MTFPPTRPPEVPLVLEVPFVLPELPRPEVPLPLLPVAAAPPVVVVYVEPLLSVVVMTPAPAPPAETAVVPVRTV